MAGGLEHFACEFGAIDAMRDLLVSVKTNAWVGEITKIYFMGYNMRLIPESDHKLFEDSTVADALMDRLLHQTIRIDLKGESLRKKK